MGEKRFVGLEAFDKVKRLLVVAAHADDLECMCGGTVALLIARGVEVSSVNCTLGDLGAQDGSIVRSALAATRIGEADAAAELLGIAQTHNLGRPDGELVADLALRADIARIYRESGADTIFTFDPYWPAQIHPDHRAVGQAAIDAYMPAKMALYRPEQLGRGVEVSKLERIFLFGTRRDVEVGIDVTEVYETKLAACLAHTSQFPSGEENLDWLKKRDASAGELLGVPYAELFKRQLGA